MSAPFSASGQKKNFEAYLQTPVSGMTFCLNCRSPDFWTERLRQRTFDKLFSYAAPAQ
jgi:hypothetical protein